MAMRDETARAFACRAAAGSRRGGAPGDERAGRHVTQFRMPPARQHFHAGELAGAQIELRLIGKPQRGPADALAQTAFDLEPVAKPLTHDLLEQSKSTTLVFLGRAQCRIGKVDEFFRFERVVRMQAHAGAGA